MGFKPSGPGHPADSSALGLKSIIRLVLWAVGFLAAFAIGMFLLTILAGLIGMMVS